MQTGGVDPGLAALVAAILSGGVGAYGFSKTSANDRADMRTAIEENLKREVGEQLREQANAEVLKRDEQIKRLEGELAQLKASMESADAVAKVAAEKSSEYNLIFQSAKPEVLRTAIPLVFAKLATLYPRVKMDGSTTPTLKTALEYPASLSGRVRRMTLADFYRKRVEPAFRADLQGPSTGGRKRRRRGGNMEAELEAAQLEAPAPLLVAATGSPASYPTYEEFAPLYTEAIKEATQSLVTKKEEGQKTAEQAKRDAIAKKAAEAIIARFEIAIRAAEAVIAEEPPEALREMRRSLSEKLDRARELIGGVGPEKKRKLLGLFGGAGTLREVTTETEWNEMNTPQKAEELLKELQDATKAYLDALRNTPAPEPVAEPAPEPVPAVAEPVPVQPLALPAAEPPALPPASVPPPALPPAEPAPAATVPPPVSALAPSPVVSPISALIKKAKTDIPDKKANPLFPFLRSPSPAAKQVLRTTTDPTAVEDEPTVVMNPLFLRQRREDAKKAQQEELTKEGPSRLSRMKTRKSFGGRSRKSTLKKRRGGKQNVRGSRRR
jgi:hypothetical protein